MAMGIKKINFIKIFPSLLINFLNYPKNNIIVFLLVVDNNRVINVSGLIFDWINGKVNLVNLIYKAWLLHSRQ